MMDKLIKLVRKGFEKIKDHRQTEKGNNSYSAFVERMRTVDAAFLPMPLA